MSPSLNAQSGRRRAPFSLVCAVLGVLLVAGCMPAAGTDAGAAREAGAAGDGPLLPEPSPFDEMVIVQASRPQTGIGTAFAVNREGDWLTARHVVDGCSDVRLEVTPGNLVAIAAIILDQEHDLALLRTGRSPYPVTLDLVSPFFIGARGVHVGFPQGRQAELSSRLVGWSRLVTQGDRQADQAILAWAETGRRGAPGGTLGGISGGPVYDHRGAVRGVVVAESPRRGQIYTTAPDAVRDFLDSEGVLYGPVPVAEAPGSLRAQAGLAAHRRLQVVKVLCQVGP